MRNKQIHIPEGVSVVIRGFWGRAHRSGAPATFLQLISRLTVTIQQIKNLFSLESDVKLCTAYHYNHNLDPYGEMSRPAVRKVETTEGSRSPSLSWTFLKSHKLSVFVFVFAPLLLTFLKALATMARSPFSSFAIPKILSELFSTSTVCVYGLYLRQKECKK